MAAHGEAAGRRSLRPDVRYVVPVAAGKEPEIVHHTGAAGSTKHQRARLDLGKGGLRADDSTEASLSERWAG